LKEVIQLIICPACQTPLIESGRGFTCPNCERSFVEREGVLPLIRDATSMEYFFPKKKFDILYQSEEKNFWFRVRNAIIRDTLVHYLSPPSHLLEVGCGTGYVSRNLKATGYHVECADLFPDALYFCKERDAGYRYYQLNLMEKLFVQEFNAICAFDVLEHIDDDITAMMHLHDALVPNGLLFITVPADMRLWSQKDTSANHKRRYSAGELQKKLEMSGFTILKMSFFMTLLYPAILLSRKIALRPEKTDRDTASCTVRKEEMSELQPNRFLNSLFFFIFSLEVPLLRAGNLPFGSSLLCVAVRTPSVNDG
jgi:SAM-dependent methyltransferase